MIEGIYSSNLVDTIRKAGMDFLIPACSTTYDDDEGWGHMGGSAPIDDIDDDIYEFEEDAAYLDDPQVEQDVVSTGRMHNMDDLMLYFNCDCMDREDFLQQNVWDLFGLTLPQFKMVKSHLLNILNCQTFYFTLQHASDLSVEQRIKWATCCAVTDCNNQTEIVKNHCQHISNLYDELKAIELIRLYLDYVRFLPNALVMNERREQNGEQTFDYSQTPKPSRIKDLHDKAFRDFQVIETERAQAKISVLNDMISEASKSAEYRRFLYSARGFTLVAPSSYDDFVKEGTELNHCIASYADAFAKMQTFIYFLRRTSEPDRPYYSLEVIPSMRTGYFQLHQCYGYGDTTAKDTSTREFIVEWCRKFGIHINCEV